MTTYAENQEDVAELMHINLYATLKRRWEYLMFGVALGLGLAALYYFTTVPLYLSEVEILVGQRTSELTNSGTITGANASGDIIHEYLLVTHMRLLTSRKLLAATVAKGKLDQLDSFRQAAERGKSPVEHILSNLTVKQGGEGTAREAMVLRASFSDPNAADAATVLNEIYEGYRTYVESHSQNTTEQAVDLIEQASKTHEQELAVADKEYREFIRSVPALIDGDQLRDVHSERVNKLEVALDLVRNQLAEQKSRLEVINAYSAKEIEDDRRYLALLSQKEVERLKLFLDMTRGETQSEVFQAEQPVRQEAARVQYNRLLELIQKEQALKDSFGESHPLVDLARKEIEITREFMENNAPNAAVAPAKKLDPKDMLETYKMLLENDINELDKRATILTNESEKEMKEAKLVENNYLQGISLKARLSRAQARYDQVILRLQEINLSKSYAGFSTDLLTVPEAASRPSWPRLSIVGLLGMFLGGCIGVLMALAAEMLDSTFSSVGDLEATAGTSVIAHIPRFDIRKLRKRLKNSSPVSASIVTFHAPRSTESENYRVARTSLLVNNRKGAVQTIMNTSPQPGDGKSTTISNLAVAFARTGKKVLLIDADLRRPVISNLFGVKDVPGLANVLRGDATIEESIFSCEVPNLTIMPNGSLTSQPAELLESHRLQKLINDAKQSFDLVLIDAPPLLAVTDPAIIAPLTDSVLLTVKITKNGRRPVEHALKILKDISITPSAVIVNGVDSSASKTYGFGSYINNQCGYVGHYHDRYSAQGNDLGHNEAEIETAYPR